MPAATRVARKYHSTLDVIKLLLKTASLNYKEPRRFGNVIRLPKNGDVLIAGDLHGNMANFKSIVQIANLERNSKRHIIFQEVIHSTNVAQEGLISSFDVLVQLAQLKNRFRGRVHMIIANHDIAQACDHYIVKGGSLLNMAFEAGLRDVYGKLTAEVKESFAHLVFSMPAAVRTRTGIFIAHSLPKRKALETFDPKALDTPMDPDQLLASSVAEMVWGRDLAQENADAFSKLVKAKLFIVGHTPCENGYKIPNSRTIIVDSKDENGMVLLLPLNKRYDSANALAGLLKPIITFHGR